MPTTLRIREATLIDSDSQCVFDHAIMDVNVLAKTVDRIGPLPGVARAVVVGGDSLAVGSNRRVQLTDGSVLNEEIIALDPPSRMAYRQMTGFGFPFSMLVRGAEGQYILTPSGKGTALAWDVRFDLTSR